MSWRYVVSSQTVNGEQRWEIRELHTDDETGEVEGWTEAPIAPSGNSWNELVANLSMMHGDAFGRQFLDLDADPPLLRDRPETVDPTRPLHLSTANRVEVVDSTGRAFSRHYTVTGTIISIQDDGRTVKVFPEHRPSRAPEGTEL